MQLDKRLASDSPRVGKHQFTMNIPLPLYQRLVAESRSTGTPIKDIFICAVEAALAVEG